MVQLAMADLVGTGGIRRSRLSRVSVISDGLCICHAHQHSIQAAS